MSSVPDIIVIDDHEFYRKGVIQALKQLPFIKVIGEFSNGVDFLKTLHKSDCNIVLMDIQMPGMDGIETARKALHQNRNLKIIGMSERIEGVNIEEIIKIGFVGFLSKDMKSGDLEYVLHNTIENKGFYSPAMMDVLINTRKSQKHIRHISKREFEVLKLIAKGLTNQQIADEFHVSIRTVQNQRASMHKKIGVNKSVQLLSWSIKNKLIENLN